MAECDAADADVRTVAAAGRDGGDDGDAAAERGDAAASDVVDDDGVAVAAGDDGGGEPEVAGTSCSVKSGPSWAPRCSRAPTYLLGIDAKGHSSKAF